MNEPRDIGIVLSGGGVKGFAHAGLLCALEEEGIFPSIVAGTSAGALIGALYASGIPAKDILGKFDRIKLLNPMTISVRKPGLINLDKFRSYFEAEFPGDNFSSLKRKLIITTTNMETGEAVYHNEGTLIDKILASCSIPGVFSPVNINGVLHMDGGIADTYPMEAMKNSSVPNIGQFVCYVGLRTTKQLSNSIRLLTRSSQLMLWHMSKDKFNQAEVFICPKELDKVAFFDMRRSKEAHEIGYRAAKAQMPEIKKLVFNHTHQAE